MRAVTIFLLASTACLGSEISGVWVLKSRATQPAASAPLAIEIDQTSDRLRILKIVADHDGKHIELVSLSATEVCTTRKGRKMRVSGETWTIAGSGELKIRRDRQRFVLVPARGDVK